jgi:hypothetical protein
LDALGRLIKQFRGSVQLQAKKTSDGILHRANAGSTSFRIRRLPRMFEASQSSPKFEPHGFHLPQRIGCSKETSLERADREKGGPESKKSN